MTGTNDTANAKGNTMSFKITTFHDGYLWCACINGDFFGRYRTQAQAWQAAADAIEGVRGN